MCVYCYHVIIPFVIKLEKFKKKIVKLVIVQVFDWLSRHVVYYLCMNECSCVRQ